MAKVRASQEFREEVETARNAMLEKKFDAFHKQAYNEESHLYLEMRREYDFIGASEFEALHGVKLQSLPGLSQYVVEIPNELNKMERGLLIRPEGKLRTLCISN